MSMNTLEEIESKVNELESLVGSVRRLLEAYKTGKFIFSNGIELPFTTEFKSQLKTTAINKLNLAIQVANEILSLIPQ